MRRDRESLPQSPDAPDRLLDHPAGWHAAIRSYSRLATFVARELRTNPAVASVPGLSASPGGMEHRSVGLADEAVESFGPMSHYLIPHVDVMNFRDLAPND